MTDEFVTMPGVSAALLEAQGTTAGFDTRHEPWPAMSDARLPEYRENVPAKWEEALPAVDEALDRIGNAGDSFDGVVAGTERVLR